MSRMHLFVLLFVPCCLSAQKTMVDKRDGISYEVVKLDSIYWMKENLRFNQPGSICIESCEAFRFYSFENLEQVCPEGWRLPTAEDWDTFVNSFEKVEKQRMLENKKQFYRVDFLDKFNLFKSNSLNIRPYGRIEGGKVHQGNFIDYWTSNSSTNDERFHMHITPYSIVGHAHKHHLKPSKPEEFRLFPIRCVCEAIKFELHGEG